MSSDDARKAPTLPRPSDVHAHAAGFDVIGMAGRYQIRDAERFCNWGLRPHVFRTMDGAINHAWDCWAFKHSRLSQVRPPPPADLADDLVEART
ncbi:hypothetical protein UFOVP469_26 [uncultured Caudovirales phage]|uniref:Uncharacterized protein n=1 Tax=uncultured Caudovirales phage TaxID=2100421 RepID=A0A6J5R118_9CAUD|nr:hypothetical protein UFOVP469_26 [uncultured Caudovirales phage]CAB4190363.1 hypothetical protein UFOVP1200_56 [uncultured Caudovirales phage]